jgi:hypothetical protein
MLDLGIPEVEVQGLVKMEVMPEFLALEMVEMVEKGLCLQLLELQNTLAAVGADQGGQGFPVSVVWVVEGMVV